MGGSMAPGVRMLAGPDDLRMRPAGTLEERFALRHDVTLKPGGVFSKVFGAEVVRTNTLHGQGINQPGPRIVVDGHAPDGTPEAIYVRDATGFGLGVQWHPEYRASEDLVSQPLFAAFGAATHMWRTAR